MVRPMGPVHLRLKGRVGRLAGADGQVLLELGSPVGSEVACLRFMWMVAVPELSVQQVALMARPASFRLGHFGRQCKCRLALGNWPELAATL